MDAASAECADTVHKYQVAVAVLDGLANFLGISGSGYDTVREFIRPGVMVKLSGAYGRACLNQYDLSAGLSQLLRQNAASGSRSNHTNIISFHGCSGFPNNGILSESKVACNHGARWRRLRSVHMPISRLASSETSGSRILTLMFGNTAWARDGNATLLLHRDSASVTIPPRRLSPHSWEGTQNAHLRRYC
jgi:hypothetical protein